ncbi:unnamed protein product [Polarella glacialis]|uniref:Peptidase S54 rhomboid domain-containing protein n=1 Tax=Polarella glacialis TaxID=89957 RepID=A0A813L4R9_POLGL|nr:unnamed protein product [Polarella glacialis]CAE8722480.1 unnamed protein product [Polarella glacialis]
MSGAVGGTLDFLEDWFGSGSSKKKKAATKVVTNDQQALKDAASVNPNYEGGPDSSGLDVETGPTEGEGGTSPTEVEATEGDPETQEGEGETEKKEKDGGILDIDGDGDVDFDDVMAGMEGEVDGEAQEGMLREHRIIFVPIQITICLALWLIGAIAYSTDGNFMLSLGGLDSFVPGMTVMKIHDQDCNRYSWQAWRWVTYQWTHGSLSHVGMNSFIVFVAGMPLEGFHGTLRMIAIFNCGVVGGALCHMLSNTHAAGLVGMSAGCYSLIGMHMADLFMNWRQNKWRKPKLLVLILLMGFDIGIAQLNSDDHVTGHSAHFGGYIAGLVMGILLVRNLKVHMWERVAQGIPLTIAIGSVAGALYWNSLWAPVSVWDAVPWCYYRQVYNPAIFGDAVYHCVRCADQACMDKYNSMQFVRYADMQQCTYTMGWWPQ